MLKMSNMDRHKVPRSYVSGAEKRKKAKEKCKKEEAVIIKTRRLTEFLKKTENDESTSASSDLPGISTSAVDDDDESEHTTVSHFEGFEALVVEHAEASDTVLSSNELLGPSFHDKHRDALVFANQLYPSDVALWPRPDQNQIDYLGTQVTK